MPVFALTNAGVSFGGSAQLDTNLIFTIAAALVFGNFIGVGSMAFISIKLKIAELPANVTSMHMLGMALLAGVGFTMAIFIANLAYPESQFMIDSSIVGILIGSVISGLAGFLVLKLAARKGK
jgi:NhaA family Na+:H+ antiporter